LRRELRPLFVAAVADLCLRALFGEVWTYRGGAFSAATT
jgi:hypothetical protein